VNIFQKFQDYKKILQIDILKIKRGLKNGKCRGQKKGVENHAFD